MPTVRQSSFLVRSMQIVRVFPACERLTYTASKDSKRTRVTTVAYIYKNVSLNLIRDCSSLLACCVVLCLRSLISLTSKPHERQRGSGKEKFGERYDIWKVDRLRPLIKRKNDADDDFRRWSCDTSSISSLHFSFLCSSPFLSLCSRIAQRSSRSTSTNLSWNYGLEFYHWPQSYCPSVLWRMVIMILMIVVVIVVTVMKLVQASSIHRLEQNP